MLFLALDLFIHSKLFRMRFVEGQIHAFHDFFQNVMPQIDHRVAELGQRYGVHPLEGWHLAKNEVMGLAVTNADLWEAQPHMVSEAGYESAFRPPVYSRERMAASSKPSDQHAAGE